MKKVISNNKKKHYRIMKIVYNPINNIVMHRIHSYNHQNTLAVFKSCQLHTASAFNVKKENIQKLKWLKAHVISYSRK